MGGSARSTFLRRAVLVMNKLLSGRHILDGDAPMLTLMIIEDMLADLGCRNSVTAAATVDQALALIGTRAFDAALLHMNLNGNKSHNVADALAERGVPFVFSTGYSTLDLRNDYRNRPVLKKPFPYEELVDVFKPFLPPMTVVHTTLTDLRLLGQVWN